MKKNKLLVLLSLFVLTSCNTQNNIKEYDYSADKDRILVKDFTLNNARTCASGIKAYRYNTTCFGIDIFYYLDKSTFIGDHSLNITGYIIIAREFDPMDRMNEYKPLYKACDEIINNKEYNWSKEKGKDRLVPIFVTYKTVYTLSEAYNFNYINDDNLSNIKDLYNNHLDECKVNIRFFSYNTF